MSTVSERAGVHPSHYKSYVPGARNRPTKCWWRVQFLPEGWHEVFALDQNEVITILKADFPGLEQFILWDTIVSLPPRLPVIPYPYPTE